MMYIRYRARASRGLPIGHPFCFGRLAVAFSSDKEEQNRDEG